MASKKGKTQPLPSYRKPPVVEVACGLNFERIEGFKIPHVGAFWSRVRKDFPNCEHAAPLGPLQEAIDPATELPVPRIWLINSSDDKLIQIQANAFYYNWRKRGNKRYPRYSSIIRDYRNYYMKFTKFLHDNKLDSPNVTHCELTYINLIPKGEGWDSEKDIRNLFPDFKWRAGRHRFLPSPTGMNWNYIFDLPNKNGQLVAKLDQATRKLDGLPILRLEMKAQGLGPSTSEESVWEWYDLAHEWIVRGFADITGSTVQDSVWERHDNNTR